MAKSIHSLFCFRKKKQRTIERKKKRSKISGLESCYANRIYVLIGVELRPYGQKLVKFCTHTHTHTQTHSAKLVVEIIVDYADRSVTYTAPSIALRKQCVGRNIPRLAVPVNVNKGDIVYGIEFIQLACCSFRCTLS